MKYKFVIILLFLLCKIYSQKTIVRTEYYKDSEQIYSKYHVFESDTTIRQGEAKFYKKIVESDYKFFQGEKNQERLLMAKGSYDGNKKVGTWEFYSDRTYLYDVGNKKLLNCVRQVHYPVLAQENGIQGMVIIQYDIDSSFNFVNFKGILGDPLLIKGAISDYQSFNISQADLLKKLTTVIGDCYQENVRDTINYILE